MNFDARHAVAVPPGMRRVVIISLVECEPSRRLYTYKNNLVFEITRWRAFFQERQIITGRGSESSRPKVIHPFRFPTLLRNHVSGDFGCFFRQQRSFNPRIRRKSECLTYEVPW